MLAGGKQRHNKTGSAPAVSLRNSVLTRSTSPQTSLNLCACATSRASLTLFRYKIPFHIQSHSILSTLQHFLVYPPGALRVHESPKPQAHTQTKSKLGKLSTMSHQSAGITQRSTRNGVCACHILVQYSLVHVRKMCEHHQHISTVIKQANGGF